MVEEWHDVLAAEEVTPGQVVAVERGDADLVVWRTAGGALCAMEARCPHQWSHLAAEGVVDGDEIEIGHTVLRFVDTRKGSR